MKYDLLIDITSKSNKLRAIESLIDEKDKFKFIQLIRALIIIKDQIIRSDNLDLNKTLEYVSSLDDDMAYFDKLQK